MRTPASASGSLPWLLLAILAATCSIYADSFAAIPISRGNVPSGFDAPWLMVGFVLVGVAACLTLVCRSAWTAGSGGAIAGLAIFAIHFIGMHALTVGGTVRWNVPMAVVSFVFAVVFADRAVHQPPGSSSQRDGSAASLQQLGELAVEGLVVCERSRIVWVNRSLEGMLPRARASRIGTRIESLLTIDALTDRSKRRCLDRGRKTRAGRSRFRSDAPSKLRPVP